EVPNYFSVTVQNIIPIDDFRGRSMTQDEKCTKDRSKKEKEYLHTAKDPARFPTKWVYSLAPPFDNDQRNKKREKPQVHKKRFRSQFLHRQSKKARDENVDARNQAGHCRNGNDFSHDLLGLTLSFAVGLVQGLLSS